MKTTAYWVTTVLLAAAYGMGGYFDFTLPKEVAEGAVKLGYPLYFFKILGVWKMLAVVALLAPGLPRLKEWCYAGILINLTSASISHQQVGDPVGEMVTPMIVLAIAITSWSLRPAGRKLAGPVL